MSPERDDAPRPPRPGRLSGKTCLIVGGTGGIGVATARRFVGEGASVIISGADSDETQRAAESLKITGIAADVRNPDEIDRLFQQAGRELQGRIDILIHVAGISGRRFGDGPLHDCSEDGWNAVMDVNARGAFFTNRAAVRIMRQQSLDDAGLRGTIVNVGSVLAESPSPRHFGTVAYAASKGAIRSLTLASASAYAPERIRFNLLCPSLIDTPMAARAVQNSDIATYLQTKQPIIGGHGRGLDVAEAALFLAEPATRFITGVVLNVDGGWSISEGQHGS
jgi:NAD(P)-dependent dehydrogenase (short-subunit alcohol dehydrogenase family)